MPLPALLIRATGFLSHFLGLTIACRIAVRLSAGSASDVRDMELIETVERPGCSLIPSPVRKGRCAVQVRS